MTSYEKRRNLIFILTYFFSSVYLLWRIFFTLPFEAGPLQAACGILLLLAELITTLGTFELYYSKMRSKAKTLEMPEVPDDMWPDVDVFIATHNEPVEILYKTVNGCTYMEYPDKSKVHIYLCDDGDREEVARLAESFSIGYLGLSGNKHAKSGNYNNALSKTSSPLIATFDADMIPQRKFLVRSVPYFLLPELIKENGVWRKRREEEREPEFKMGLVQTPQSFYNQDLFQFNLYAENEIPNEQDFFSNEINVLRNATNSCAYTGSNTVILRKAMEEIGGFPYKTITEDFETSLRLQKAGYITYATTEILAAGLSTTDFASMIKQRIRWAQGVIQSIQNTNAIFTRKLKLGARISYLNAYLYWWSFLMRMIFILAPILYALFGFQLVTCTFPQLMMFWLPSFIFYSLSMRYLSTNVRNLRWSQVVDTIFAPYLIVPVLLESIGIHQRKFKVTSKNKTSNWTTSLHFVIPHAVLTVLTLLSMVRFLWGKYGVALIYSSIIPFWLLYNLTALIYSILFMLGRESKRKFERIKADERVCVSFSGRTYEGRTVDVSEEGIAFRLPASEYIPEQEEFQIEVDTRYYHARLNASLVYVKQTEGGWDYAAQVVPVDEENKRSWLQIIHDRIHSLPKTLDPWMTAYDDIRRNIQLRIVSRIAPKRKTARFGIHSYVQFSDGASGMVEDYNYRYFSVSDFQKGNWDEKSSLRLRVGGYLFLLKRDVMIFRGGRRIELFEVINLDELLQGGMQADQIADALAASSEQEKGAKK